MRWWPRSIRWQMLSGLLLLEALSLVLFSSLLIHQQTREVYDRAKHRLAHQSTSLALQAREALLQKRDDWVGLSVKMMGEAPSVGLAKITDPAGDVLFVSSGDPIRVKLDSVERAQIASNANGQPIVFTQANGQWEGVDPIYVNRELKGYAWVETDRDWDREQLNSILRSTLIFGVIWIGASALLVLLMANSISRPLAVLRNGTRALMSSPEDDREFPLPVSVQNEVGDLIEVFNRMVASIAEQRSGLNDTLSLLDSMLANAPIGLAFFDRSCRLVRVNQVFADMTGVQLDRHLGRTLPELLPQPVAQDFEKTVQRVFSTEQPVRDLELSSNSDEKDRCWTWLASAYPVRTTPHEIRWVGAIVLDASERKRSEEALRKTEKLAATGRLAASIAHEINNPLEAITNLLFLLSNFCELDEREMNYVRMAEAEAHRISEITQQTLRFYRQSTQPTRANMRELLDSVISLYQGRSNTLNIQLERHYDEAMDLFCYSGELRQVFANLIGNAIDAIGSDGGKLLVRARRSKNWKDPSVSGIRFTFADTGCGMDPSVRERIFEAFFTTKEVTGTGLGLWVSHEIILKHHGQIRVKSRVGNSGKPSGTAFQLFFPDDPNLMALPNSVLAKNNNK